MQKTINNSFYFMSPFRVIINFWVLLFGFTIILQGRVYLPMNFGMFHVEGIAAQVFSVFFIVPAGFLLWRHYLALKRKMISMVLLNSIIYILLFVACIGVVLMDWCSAVAFITVLSLVFLPVYMIAIKNVC